jgi:hypothetical protein
MQQSTSVALATMLALMNPGLGIRAVFYEQLELFEAFGG